MNKTAVDFLKDYHKRLMEKELRAVNARVETEFKREAQRMIQGGIISNQDYLDALKALKITLPPTPRNSVTNPRPRATLPDTDPCGPSSRARSSC